MRRTVSKGLLGRQNKMPQVGELKEQTVVSHSPEAGSLRPRLHPEATGLGLRVPIILPGAHHPAVCSRDLFFVRAGEGRGALRCLFLLVLSDLGPTPRTLLNPNYFLRGPIWKPSHRGLWETRHPVLQSVTEKHK